MGGGVFNSTLTTLDFFLLFPGAEILLLLSVSTGTFEEVPSGLIIVTVSKTALDVGCGVFVEPGGNPSEVVSGEFWKGRNLGNGLLV